MLFSARKVAVASSNSEMFFCVSSLTFLVATCDVLHSSILFISSSFLAWSAKRAASATSLRQRCSLITNLWCPPSSNASSSTVTIQNLSADQSKTRSTSSTPTQVLSLCCRQLFIFMVISLSRASHGGFAPDTSLVARRSTGASCKKTVYVCSAELPYSHLFSQAKLSLLRHPECFCHLFTHRMLLLWQPYCLQNLRIRLSKAHWVYSHQSCAG